MAQFFGIHGVRLLAIWAELSDQSLSQNTTNGGGDEERLHADVSKTREDRVKDSGDSKAGQVFFEQARTWARFDLNEAAALMVSENVLDAPAASIKASLRMRTGGIVFHRGAATYPWRSHAVWFILQMLRWKQCWMAPNFADIASDVYRCETYREAAALIGEPCPRADYKSEGARLSGSSTPSTDGGSIMLGSDAMLDGSIFDAADPLGWLKLQRHGLPAVGYASLQFANVRQS